MERAFIDTTGEKGTDFVVTGVEDFPEGAVGIPESAVRAGSPDDSRRDKSDMLFEFDEMDGFFCIDAACWTGEGNRG